MCDYFCPLKAKHCGNGTRFDADLKKCVTDEPDCADDSILRDGKCITKDEALAADAFSRMRPFLEDIHVLFFEDRVCKRLTREQCAAASRCQFLTQDFIERTGSRFSDYEANTCLSKAVMDFQEVREKVEKEMGTSLDSSEPLQELMKEKTALCPKQVHDKTRDFAEFCIHAMDAGYDVCESDYCGEVGIKTPCTKSKEEIRNHLNDARNGKLKNVLHRKLDEQSV